MTAAATEGEREEREADEASYSPLLLSKRSRTSFRRRRLLALRSARASRASRFLRPGENISCSLCDSRTSRGLWKPNPSKSMLGGLRRIL